MYQSPFHLIDPEVFTAGSDPAALKRRLGLEKKKLLAEFELAGTATITVNGRELQRQDLTLLFDELQRSEQLAFHLAVWRHGAFLHFLETGRPGAAGDWLYPDDENAYDALIRGISPHYAEALNRYLRRCLQGQDDPEALLYELRATYWLLPAHYETAYRHATRFFTEKKNELLGIRYRSETGEQVTTTELRDWCSDEQIHVLNRLPDSFDDMRYTLAELLNNLCVLYDRQQAKKHALAAIERAATIRVNDEELERLVPANLRIIRNKNGSGLMHVDPDTGKRRVKFIPVLVMIVLFFRLLAAGSGCFEDEQEERSQLRRLPTTETAERSPQEESFSSLIRALGAPQAFGSGDTMLEKAIMLRRPAKTGDDPFARLLDGMRVNNETLNAGLFRDSSSVLLRNSSTEPAVFLLQFDATVQRSVYIAPGAQWELRYPNVPMDMHVYAGHDWSDTLWNSYLRYRTSTFALRQAFRGGFLSRIPIAFDDADSGKPIFSRTPPEQGTSDTLSLVNTSNGLGVYYNLGRD